MDLGLTGKKVVITGGSMGIGLACARVFAQEGCDIVIAARNPGRLAQATSALAADGLHVTAFVADLARDSERERLAEAHGEADILVNNAGAIPGGSLFDIDMARWQEAWSLKVMGYIHLTQLYLRAMKERRAGTIVNIIGGAGRSPRWDYICGSAGNAALMAFTGAVGGRSTDFGVRVFGINPSPTRTERNVSQMKLRARNTLGDENRWEELNAGLPFGRPSEPHEIANAATFLASPACGYVSGAVVDIDGGGAFR